MPVSMDRAEATNLISLLYELVLDRSADAGGLAGKVDALVSGRRTVTDIVTEFGDSYEYMRKRPWRRPNLTGFQRLPQSEVFVPSDVVAALFAKTATYWRDTASAAEELYWSVVSEDEWKGAPTLDRRRVFLASGRSYADRVLAEFTERTGRPASELMCLDFGCGVGRIAVNFAARVAHVHAVDLGRAHLDELQANARLLGCERNLSAWLLEQPSDLAKVPQVDVVYSVISLQHNTPPVIAYFVDALVRRLRPGGLAFLHSILARADYAGFDVAGYLADPGAGIAMEEHILPRANLDDVVRRAGGEIVTSRCIGGNYDAYSEEFVIRRAEARTN